MENVSLGTRKGPSGNDVDVRPYSYAVSYAPRGTAKCRACKQYIAAGELRIGRATPNPFDAEGGTTTFVQYYHADHAFGVFQRSKCTSRVPTSPEMLVGFDALAPADRDRVAMLLAAFRDFWIARLRRDV
jgi:hypothetical protein